MPAIGIEKQYDGQVLLREFLARTGYDFSQHEFQYFDNVEVEFGQDGIAKFTIKLTTNHWIPADVTAEILNAADLSKPRSA